MRCPVNPSCIFWPYFSPWRLLGITYNASQATDILASPSCSWSSFCTSQSTSLQRSHKTFNMDYFDRMILQEYCFVSHTSMDIRQRSFNTPVRAAGRPCGTYTSTHTHTHIYAHILLHADTVRSKIEDKGRNALLTCIQSVAIVLKEVKSDHFFRNKTESKKQKASKFVS